MRRGRERYIYRERENGKMRKREKEGEGVEEGSGREVMRSDGGRERERTRKRGLEVDWCRVL